MIKAIETEYNGHRFRSRLEARWAVFFDHLRWEWEYEPEGFDLPHNGYYLPDFLVKPAGSPQLWFEIKGKSVSSVERNKLREVSVHTGKVGIFVGSEHLKDLALEGNALYQRFGSVCEGFSIRQRLGFNSHEYPLSRYVPWHSQGERREMGWHEVDPGEDFRREVDSWACHTSRYLPDVPISRSQAAAKAALSARFEHGEKPEPPPAPKTEYRVATVMTAEQVLARAEEIFKLEDPATIQLELHQLAMENGYRDPSYITRLYLANSQLTK